MAQTLMTARRWFTAYRTFPEERCIFNGWSTRQQMEAVVEVEERDPQNRVTVYQGRSPMRVIYETGKTYGYLTSPHLKGH